ncbi:hypothetical protein QLH32_05125 [Acinetobacter corruptisaponis]|uniref:Uncharacterized protein n=1 Tax=Acinetobacter corruptisaponis TaxID=3045147 RepID=A0ABY8S633_9GAMM|nr:hypothetical protein [Acinetobacter sp. KCTC 92772]WHP06856.1 hypothetical protein QLH32_05125 [Acinetobacter sp. KCTC 92772]
MTDQQQQQTQEQNQESNQNQNSMLGGGHEGEIQDGGEQGNQGQGNNSDTPKVPESADGYEVNIDGFDFNEFKGIEENKAFLDEAHKAGLSNEQLGFVLGKYNEIIPQLMEANAHLDNESCIQTMTEAWGNDTQTNFGFAKAAADNAIANGILTAEEVNSPQFGNNPLVLKMAAYFGQQLGEDTPPKNTHQSGGTDVQSLMSSEAYLSDKHPDHARVTAQVQNWYQKQYK